MEPKTDLRLSDKQNKKHQSLSETKGLKFKKGDMLWIIKLQEKA